VTSSLRKFMQIEGHKHFDGHLIGALRESGVKPPYSKERATDRLYEDLTDAKKGTCVRALRQIYWMRNDDLLVGAA